MAVDYKKQYRPDQLEPFWPNEIVKMTVVVLCTLALIMFMAVLPVILDNVGLHGAVHHEEPADPHGPTPVGIKPEWYFLAVYQHLRLMPTELLGVSGKTWGVLSQGAVMPVLLLVPFWYRKRAAQRPGMVYRVVVTVAIGGFLTLTVWGGWPEEAGGEGMIPFTQYFREHALFFAVLAAALIAFYALIAHEVRMIRRVLDAPAPEPAPGPPPEAGAAGAAANKEARP